MSGFCEVVGCGGTLDSDDKCIKCGARHPPKKEIKDSGERIIFGTGAQRDQQGDKGSFSLLPWDTLRALAIHYQKGAKKYKKRNWELGMPISQYFDSCGRHHGQWIGGHMDEYNHPIADIWNEVCAYQTILWIQEGKLPLELYDMPNKVVLPDPYGRPEFTFKSWEEVEARWKDKWSKKEP